MKMALISEEQIKTLYEYLLKQPINTGNVELCELLMSLKVQEPVAWKKTAEGIESTRNQQLAERLGFSVPLYAGEQS